MDCCCHKLVLPRGPGPCNSFFLRIDRNASTGYTRTTTSTSMARLCCQPNRRTKRNEREKIKYRLDRANGRSTRAKTCIPPLPPSLSPSLSLSLPLSLSLSLSLFLPTERHFFWYGAQYSDRARVRPEARGYSCRSSPLLHIYRVSHCARVSRDADIFCHENPRY